MIGRNLAHYRIVEKIGAGGMGEVYRATDTKLGRDVALKVLPAAVSADPERIARFDREARTLASLQHPNVASIYGFEEAEGTRFLIMELVEGTDLAARLRAGPVSLDETRRIALQIATGLEAAHDRGIVHRDLKPANIMLSDSGEAKILDFGLARAWLGDSSDSGSTMTSPVISAAMTEAGTILGTAAYMSPEQARGRNVDRRADIWAFGAILWEMVTGERIFEGETISDTLAAVLRAEPDWDRLPVDEAPHLCRLIERCLVRDPRQRLRDIGEARILLQEGGAESSILSIPAPAPDTDSVGAAAPSGLRRPVVAAIAVAALVLGAIVARLLGPAGEAPLLHVMLPAPPGTEFDLEATSPGPAVLSPDGKMVAFSARGEDGIAYLYLRRLDQGEAVRLSGTDDATYPFWSPDGKFIAFFTVEGGKLRKIAVDGGPPITICPASNGKGGSWNRDGVIIFAPAAADVIHRVPSIGGDPEPITELADGENSHRHPRFLPDGKDFLFLARGDASFEVEMGSLDGGEPRPVTESECQAEFAAGNLFTAREGVLFATPFDPGTGKLTGGGTPLVEQLLIMGQQAGAGAYSVLPSGRMLFQTGTSVTERILSWGDLETQATVQIGSAGQMWVPSISPDGTQCAVEIQGEAPLGTDLWIVDLKSGQRDRFTFEEGDEVRPCWTPDGSAIIYTSRANEVSRIIEQPVLGTGGASVLYESPDALYATSVHPDGSRLLFTRVIPDTSQAWNLEVLELDGDGTPTVLLAGEGYGGCYSPNGRWVAYGGVTADEWQVFVMPADGGPRKWQVTNSGAVWPQWQPDGRRLFVLAYGSRIAGLEVDPDAESFRFGVPEELMDTGNLTARGSPFSVHPDGRRIVQAWDDPHTAGGEISPIHLVTDWPRMLVR